MNKLSITIAVLTIAACALVFLQVRDQQFAQLPEAAEQTTKLPPATAADEQPGSVAKMIEAGSKPETVVVPKVLPSKTVPAQSSRPTRPSRMPAAEIVSIGDELHRTRDPLQRRRLFMDLIDNLTEETAAEMREQILRLPHHSQEFRDFHYALGQIMGEAAVVQGTETPERDMADSLKGWASIDPNAAYDWFAERIANGETKFSSGGSGNALVAALATSDLDLATETAITAGAESTSIQQKALYSIAATLATTNGVDEAAEWATTIEDGKPQKLAVMNVARIWAHQDVEDAFEWAIALDDEKMRETALTQVGYRYVQVDPEKALPRLQESGLSESVLKTLRRRIPKKRR
jgi:hypothetical protein